MKEWGIYSISDRYIAYLQKNQPNVYSNKMETRVHTRKYVGIVLKMHSFYYYVPMSSPKKSDFQIAGSERVIKKSIVPIIRIVVKNRRGEKELIGTLRISHMIPVPESELFLYDPENETDENYRALIQDQMIFIRKNQEKIRVNAQLMYKQKKERDATAGYVKTALDYETLEELCSRYQSGTQKG